jgi:2,4-dienoyl-CoA reductase-like NADH-dependent reductase (Old Yellow Enzyme family)
LTSEFARAAAQARDAGFDGIQIHAAHGYLLSQFLSPHYNRRTDHYGGDPANRARALLEVLEAVRREVGEDFPIIAKINADDTLADGVRPSDMVETAMLLEKGGIDAVELSGGCKDGRHSAARKGRIDGPDKEVYYRDAARLYKERIKVPLILVGGIRSLETAEGLVRDGTADYVSMCRPLIREPGLVNRWKSGDRRPSGCLSDNLCYGPIRAGEGIRCVMEPNDRNTIESTA